MIRKRKKLDKTKGISVFIVALMLVLTYAPVMTLVIYSFTDTRALGSWDGFTFGLYRQAFTNRTVLTALRNSLVIAAVAASAATLIGTAAAVGIFYMRRKPRTTLTAISQITAVNAPIVTGAAFVLLFMFLAIPSGFASIMIAHTVICIPFVILSVTPRLSQLDPNVYDAGLDLGASHLRTFFTVVLPQLIGSMVSGFMIAFVISLDDFAVMRHISGHVNTIPRYLYFNLVFRSAPNYLRAVSTVFLAATLIGLIFINVVAAKRGRAKRDELRVKV